jgi:general secretion pathway protein C
LNSLIKLIGADGRYVNSARVVVTFFLLGLVVQAAAIFTWQMVGPVTLSSPRPAVKQLAARVPGSSRAGIGAAPVVVPGLLLFGQAEKSAEAKFDASLPLPQTTLNLQLKGVIAFTPKERALAIINEKGKNEEDKVYGLGDKVPGNAEVKEIYPDRVILSRDGKYETLLLVADPFPTPVGQNLPDKRATGQPITSLGDGKNWQLSKSFFQEKISDIPALAQEIGLEVYKEGAAQQGYRLTSIGGSKMLGEIGLQPGDILYEVNGIKLTDASLGLTAFKRIKDAPRINMVIGRGGQRMTRSYRIENNQ